MIGDIFNGLHYGIIEFYENVHYCFEPKLTIKTEYFDSVKEVKKEIEKIVKNIGIPDYYYQIRVIKDNYIEENIVKRW